MVDLKKQFQEIKDDVYAVLRNVIESGHYILGPHVTDLEKRLADYHGVREAIGVASCTDALHLSIEALGIKQGDEVITTPFTFFATVEAILYAGALPVFVDIEPDTFNINTSEIEAHITKKTSDNKKIKGTLLFPNNEATALESNKDNWIKSKECKNQYPP